MSCDVFILVYSIVFMLTPMTIAFYFTVISGIRLDSARFGLMA